MVDHDILAEFRQKHQDKFDNRLDQNIIASIGLDNAENPHTRLLSWLLDPNGYHGADETFLHEFCDLIDIDRPTVIREVKSFDSGLGVENAEVDIVVLGDNTCIGIEVKTTHSAGSDQLEREYKALRDVYNRPETALVYLTNYPQSCPEVEFEEYRRVEWGQVANRFIQNRDAADQEWRGFLDHLFEHLREQLMKDDIKKLRDVPDDKVERARLYAELNDLIEQGESDFWDITRQFLKDVNSAVEDKWGDQLDARLRSRYDLDNREVIPKNIAFYRDSWPSAAAHDEKGVTIRYQVYVRRRVSHTGSTAQADNPLSSEFNYEINLDIPRRYEDFYEKVDEIRNAIVAEISGSKLDSLFESGFKENFANAGWHVMGKGIESSWPPDGGDVQRVIDNLELLRELEPDIDRAIEPIKLDF